MSALLLEAFLAKIYVDETARARFLADPSGEAAQAGLTPQEVADVAQIDRVGLDLVARSLTQKRRGRFRKPVE